MDDLFLLVDFGSTYTKVLAVDLVGEVVLGRSQSNTTVETNILEGLQSALGRLTIDGKPVSRDTLRRARKLASSSAAGGLRLVAVGLVPDLTLKAATAAALGAGAKVVGSYGYELDEDALDQIERNPCDMVLVVGGIDGGNKDVILHNAEALATRSLDVPFVVAGNRVVSHRVQSILEASGKYAVRAENVLPELDRLNVEPARSCIRDVFMKRIVHAKGFDKAQEFIGDILMPTPLATLKAASLLADGHGSESGLGELMVVEVGGATTNIHSVATGQAREGGAVPKGIPEPYEKRTVEGDLGIRCNAATIVSLVGAETVRGNTGLQDGLCDADLEAAAASLSRNTGFVPETDRDFALDAGLARSAVEVAVARHAGFIQESWGLEGVVRLQHGKDLTGLRTVVGTGGVFAYNPHSEKVLEGALASPASPFSLKPKAPELFIDRSYVLYGVGLLSTVEPAIALRVAKKSLVRVRP